MRKKVSNKTEVSTPIDEQGGVTVETSEEPPAESAEALLAEDSTPIGEQGGVNVETFEEPPAESTEALLAEDSIPIGEQGEVTVETLETAAPAEAPKADKPLFKKAVYKTVYAVSFGTVFGSLLIKKLLIPKDSIIEAALHDGAVAARKALEGKEHWVAETGQETQGILSGDEPEATAA